MAAAATAATPLLAGGRRPFPAARACATQLPAWSSQAGAGSPRSTSPRLQNAKPPVVLPFFPFSTAARLPSLRLGRQLHAHFVASPYSADDVVKSSLVDMYCKCGVPQDARKVFDSIGVKNSVVWTALVSGYASNGCTDEAIDLFRSMPARSLFTWTALISGFVKAGNNTGAVGLFVEMRRDGVRIDDAFVLATVVGGAADLAALVLGRQLHGFALRLGFLSSMIVGNALVDMYSKCSDIHSAREVFEGITVRDVISWTTILVGEAQHGRAEEVLALYDRMLLAGMKPNEVTFVGLIYACSHAGLV